VVNPPTMRPSALYWIWKNLPNRDELSFLVVLAFPKASSTGLESRMTSLTRCELPPAAAPARISSALVRKRSTCFVASVLPAPLSPQMTTDWLCFVLRSWLRASWATAKM